MLAGPRNRSSCCRSSCMSLLSVDVLAFVLHMTTNSKVNDALKKSGVSASWKVCWFSCGQTSGSTQICRISFYHSLSYGAVIQASPSACPVNCVISGSVLVLVFTFILSSTVSLFQEVWMFLSHVIKLMKAHALVLGRQRRFFTDRQISACSTLLFPFAGLSLPLHAVASLFWCYWILYVCPCPF